ncbi:MAG: EAL domain-containing protein [Methyloprofundus sp.]|nr:EAL domain-containing protein [Methyloprofundus sp.]
MNFFLHLVSLLFIALPSSVTAFNNTEQNTTTNNIVQSVELTTEERLWLDSHQPIRIAFDGDFAPYSFIDNGKLAGIAYDTLQLISQKLDIQFQVDKRNAWKDLYIAAINKEIDIVATMVNRPERLQFFTFTRPYIFKSLVIITNKNGKQITNRSQLSGKIVALVEGYQYSTLILNEFPSITPFYVDSMQDALEAVESEQADAAISFFAASAYLQDKYLLTQLKFGAFYDRNSANESIAVRNDWPILATILQKGLDILTPEEKQAINERWHTQFKLPVDYVTLAKFIAPLLLIVIILLLWIRQIRHQNIRINKAKNKLLAANTALENLKENLEVKVFQRTDQLHKSEKKYRSLVENLHDEYFFYQHDLDGVFSYLSPSITKILGYSVAEFSKHYSTYQTDHPDNTLIDDYKRRCINSEKVPAYEIELFDKQSNKRCIEVLESPVYDTFGQCIGLEGIAHDITLLKQAQTRLNWLSYYDDLTGLANRRLFLDRLEQTLTLAHRHNHSAALLFLDVDRFKIVNDNLGHAAGDEVLKETANRLLDDLRDSDLAARVGGDEFTLILPDTDADAAEIVAKKVLQHLLQPYILNEQQFILGSSIGIAIYPADGKNVKTLLQQADNAMYCAKKAKQGYAFCSSEQIHANNRRLILEQSLRKALAQDCYAQDFELKMAYQAKRCLKTNKTVGYEALMRWHHSELGNISPIEFIPLAEETGLIVELSHWVMTAVCLQSVHWSQVGFDFGKIAVNISAVELINLDLANKIIGQIDNTGAQRKWIEIEITENALMKTPEIAIKIMCQLVEAGVLIAIDDFGTGYSSLSYMKNLPASFIKIDRSFIRNLLNSKEDQAVIHAVLAMSHALGKQVIAEGVETPEQLQFLAASGCDIAQGYWIAKPLAVEDIN